MPEFNGIGDETESAPVARKGDPVSRRPAFQEVGFPGNKRLPVGDSFSLQFRNPGGDLGFVRPGAEVAFRLFRVRADDGALDGDLALEFLPKEDEGGVRIGIEVVPLVGSVVREEAEAPIVEPLEQHRAG